MPPYLVMAFWAFYVGGAAALALWRGGGLERAASIAALLAWLASVFVTDNQHWMRPQYAVFAVDCLLAVALVLVALRSRALWSYAAAGCQLTGVLFHIVFAVAPYTISPKGYLAAGVACSTLVVGAIWLGVLQSATGRAPRAALRD